MSDRVILISFLAWLFKYGVHFAISLILYKVSLAHHFFPNGTSKFQMAHQNLDFCMQMNES